MRTWTRIINTPYEVSKFGNVRRMGSDTNLVPCDHYAGYKQVKLSIKGKTTNHYVHRLVAAAYCANPDNKPHVNHKDGDRTNNRATNLEWCTINENNLHARMRNSHITDTKTCQP